MKRVLLHGVDEYRAAAVALATYAVDGDRGRVIGDAVHEWITEGRRAQYERALAAGYSWAVDMAAGYSSCGDLAHWLLWCLGARDERVINRDSDGGARAWDVCVNLSRLTRSPWYVDFDGELAMPAEGDVLHVSSPEHVAILTRIVDATQWFTADYGQPHGLQRVCQLRDVSQGLQVRGRYLRGFVSIARALACGAFVETAIVPDAFLLGDVDDNPYTETIPIPRGIMIGDQTS